jgi:AbrB family looped-hinge helix DNA binding protein
METRISKSGRISIPASIRRRWGTDRVEIEDRGDAVVLRPLPSDRIAAARGSLKLSARVSSERLRDVAREDEEIAEERKASLARDVGPGAGRRRAG